MTISHREIRFFQQISGDYYQLYCQEVSPESARETVVLLHDYAGNSRDFQVATRRLVTHGYRVLAPDLPGRGSSAALPVDAYTLVNLAQSLNLSIEGQCDQPPFLAAIGWGGVVAMLAAALRPDRYRKLICIDTHPHWTAVDPAPYEVMKTVSEQIFPSLKAIAEALEPVFECLPGMGTRQEPRGSRIAELDNGYRFLAHPSIFEFAILHAGQPIDFSGLFLNQRIPTCLWYADEIPETTKDISGRLAERGVQVSVVEHTSFKGEIPLTTERQLLMLLGSLA